MHAASPKLHRLLVLGAVFIGLSALGTGCPFGLSFQAFGELHAAGVDKYLGDFAPASSEDAGDGWTKYTYDTDGGNGPICIAGTPFTVYTRMRNPDKLMVFLQGGGACWQDFYFCNILADSVPPTSVPGASGIWVDSYDTGSGVVDNPLADWSIVYVPYCDGSVFSGDNDVVDANFPFGPVRFHRGLRNLSAAMDLAKDVDPHPYKVVVAGSSAGGVGAAGFAPFLARFLWGNFTQLSVFNDAGPITVNLDDTVAVAARANDWQFGQFYPASCTECSAEGKATENVAWRLDNDRGIREGFFDTDGDATDRFFLNVPTQEAYRELIVTEHGALRDAHPTRYKRMIRSGDDTHTSLQSEDFYNKGANGLPLYKWTDRFLNKPFGIGWIDIVEDFVPLP